jgi:DNA-binding CsgD family transcriptional regulator
MNEKMNSSDAQDLMTVYEKSNEIKLPSLREKNEILNQIKYAEKISHLFASGNCFYFLMNFIDMKIDYVSNSIFNVLGINKDDASIDSLLSIWHPEDLKKMPNKEKLIFKFLYEHIPTSDILHYKVSYLNRLKDSSGIYKKILHQSSAIALSLDNKLEYTFTVETDLSHLNIPMSDKITFLGINGRPSFYCDDMKSIKPLKQTDFNLTNREIEILSLISKGFSSKSIAKELNISNHTVTTHKKNIMIKSNAENMIHLISQLVIEGII